MGKLLCMGLFLVFRCNPSPRGNRSQVLLRPAHLKWGNFTVQPTDHSFDYVLPASDRFSFFVSEVIHRDFGIGGLLPAARKG
jgi:hypothetical protein